MGNYTAEYLIWIATNALRIDVVKHCLHLDLSFYLAYTPGELIERIDGDVEMLSNLFSRFLLVIVSNTLLVIGMLIVLFSINFILGISLLAYALFFLIVQVKIFGLATPYFMKARQAEAKLSGFLEERLSGTEDIRANGAVTYVLKHFTLILKDRLIVQRRAETIGQIIGGSRMFMYMIGTFLVLGLSGSLYQQGIITIGTVYAAFTYTTSLWDPLLEITNQLGDFQKSLAAFERLNELLRTQPSIVDGTREAFPDDILNLTFEQVTFGYDEAVPVVENISFSLTSGKTLGILGRTGSGKTTLTRLLFRFYDPQSGCILLNEVDIRTVKLRVLRTRLALVTQDVQLFHATLRENLTFFNSTIPDSEILNAFEALGLLQWYQSLPAGLDTMLSSDQVSAGQAQLIALTRVFLTHPDIIILDEASSRLDPATEALLDQAISHLLQGKMGIIIAHRLSTIKNVDSILILEKGRISEYGDRKDLEADQNSHFSHLLRVGLMEVLS